MTDLLTYEECFMRFFDKLEVTYYGQLVQEFNKIARENKWMKIDESDDKPAFAIPEAWAPKVFTERWRLHVEAEQEAQTTRSIEYLENKIRCNKSEIEVLKEENKKHYNHIRLFKKQRR
jgi:hypothetical protein